MYGVLTLNFTKMNNDILYKLIAIVCTWITIYIIGLIITLNPNPMDWWLISHAGGRIVLIILIFLTIRAATSNDI